MILHQSEGLKFGVAKIYAEYFLKGSGPELDPVSALCLPVLLQRGMQRDQILLTPEKFISEVVFSATIVSLIAGIVAWTFTTLFISGKPRHQRRILQHLQEAGVQPDQPQIRPQPGTRAGGSFLRRKKSLEFGFWVFRFRFGFSLTLNQAWATIPQNRDMIC